MAAKNKQLNLKEILALTGGRSEGAEDVVIDGVASLEEADEQKLSFLGNERYRNQILPSKAVIVIVPEDYDEPVPEGRCWIYHKDPSHAFSQVMMAFAPEPHLPAPGIHEAAVIAADVQLGKNVHVGACAVIEDGAEIGDDAIIEAGSYIGKGVILGEACRIYPNVTIREYSLLGDRVIIHSGTVIGSDGFGYIPNPEGHVKIPQIGNVQIDNDVEIGSNVSVDRARFGKTWIQEGTKIDNLVQIGHNVVIGKHCFIVAQVALAGSARIGNLVQIAGHSGVAGHLEIGDGTTIMANTKVYKSFPAGSKIIGEPAMPHREYYKIMARFRRLPEIYDRLRDIEKKLEEDES